MAANNQDITKIKNAFDELIIRHLRRLLEVETLDSSLSFNLSTIACLLLLVERENDIKNFPESPPERFTRETFLDELSAIGLDVDDDLMVAFQALAQLGYVDIDAKKRYNAQISTFAIVNFLNNLFPGMTGMNFVAYIIQMIDEASTGRKDLDEALSQFDQTLRSQGTPLSKQKLATDEKEKVRKQAKRLVDGSKASEISEDLKKAYTKKLSRMRSVLAKDDSGPRIFQAGRPATKARIKELFKREDDETGDAFSGSEVDETEIHKLEQETVEKAALEAAEKRAAELAERETELAAKEAEIKAAELAAREAELKAREAEIDALENEIKTKEEKEPVQSLDEDRQGPEDIEGKIQSYQQSLAMLCPICSTGKIQEDLTEKGRVYFSCSNEGCGFVSWGKPYAFPCPLCKNPFLIEYEVLPNKPGLKCPRATCSFTQDYLGPPRSEGDGGTKSKKKRRLVRRVRRR